MPIRHPWRLSAALLTALALTACAAGMMAFDDSREEWRSQADRTCRTSGRVTPSPFVTPMEPIFEEGECGADAPYKVTAAADGSVAFSVPATLACPMLPALDRWLQTVVQPAAGENLDSKIVSVDVAASYVCRTRNNKPGAKVSEHAYANAIDISAFRTADGRRVTVADGWKGAPQEAAFLKTVHDKACGPFNTVIGPDGDRHHQDHFHLDLARRGRNGDGKFCQ
ncbi:extensin-like domain-containing protein [Rhodobium gokarnense]|uniref:Extensin-like C-terminal domain-containing protein n=1 Tax=Rhodobium gokarnense TaxID=364296 RepID=A0ABT3H9K2_9HYPH|nr:extensin family protein [Rhodobium gokarnense]MCW2307075.1 hypothetical protein [Rhodobium gokarnense]